MCFGVVKTLRTTLKIIFNVNMVTFQMTLLANTFTNTVMDDGCVHSLAKTLPSLVNNL